MATCNALCSPHGSLTKEDESVLVLRQSTSCRPQHSAVVGTVRSVPGTEDSAELPNLTAYTVDSLPIGAPTGKDDPTNNNYTPTTPGEDP